MMLKRMQEAPEILEPWPEVPQVVREFRRERVEHGFVARPEAHVRVRERRAVLSHQFFLPDPDLGEIVNSAAGVYHEGLEMDHRVEDVEAAEAQEIRGGNGSIDPRTHRFMSSSRRGNPRLANPRAASFSTRLPAYTVASSARRADPDLIRLQNPGQTDSAESPARSDRRVPCA